MPVLLTSYAQRLTRIISLQLKLVRYMIREAQGANRINSVRVLYQLKIQQVKVFFGALFISDLSGKIKPQKLHLVSCSSFTFSLQPSCAI